MMPTDEKFIEWLKKVKEYCRSRAFNNCKECKFFVYRYLDDRGRECGYCQFSWIASKLTGDPADWNIKDLESIIHL